MAPIDPLAALGVSTAALGGLAGAWATIQSRRTEHHSANREETQQAIDTLEALNERLEVKVEKLETKNASLEDRVNGFTDIIAIMTIAHEQCERRLRIAEARILEMGG